MSLCYNDKAVYIEGYSGIGHWKLNNKRLKKYKAKSKYSAKIKISLEILKENTTQTKSKRSSEKKLERLEHSNREWF